MRCLRPPEVVESCGQPAVVGIGKTVMVALAAAESAEHEQWQLRLRRNLHAAADEFARIQSGSRSERGLTRVLLCGPLQRGDDFRTHLRRSDARAGPGDVAGT